MQNDSRAFGIAGDWKATALEAGVWVKTVTDGGRRFMAAWTREGENAARYRQAKREANETSNKNVVIVVQGSVEPPKRHRLAQWTSRGDPVWTRDGPPRPP